MRRAAIGIGSNLGDPRRQVQEAFARLAVLGTVVACSRLYRTRPWGVTDQPAFVNAAALLDTVLAPGALLAGLQRLEREAGRVPAARWAPRALDLDILTYDARQVEQPGLTIPHPRLRERAFALVPLAEIDPAWIAARDALPPGEQAAVVELEEP